MLLRFAMPPIVPNPDLTQLGNVVRSWYLRKWNIIRFLAYGCLGLLCLVLFIIVGASLEGGSGIAVPLILTVVLGAPSLLFARYANTRVANIDDHELVRTLRENPIDVEVVDRSWTIVPDLTVAGLISGRKERMPCLRLRVGSSQKRYVVPMSEAQCDEFVVWLGSLRRAGSGAAA